MANPVILSRQDIAGVFSMHSAIDAVEKAYAYKSSGEAELFPVVGHVFSDGKSELDIKSGGIDQAGIFGAKIVSYFPGNTAKGHDALMGTILIFQRETGKLLAIMDGTRITAMRTGAAGAVGAKYLARPESRNLLMVGAGAQALSLVTATLLTMENIHTVTVFDPISPERAKAFASGLLGSMEKEYLTPYKGQARYKEITDRLDVHYASTENLQAACGEADIILTATPSRKALVLADWVKPGTHLSCIGADMDGKQEVEAALLVRARLFADDVTQSISIGECQVAYEEGIIGSEDIAEIGEVVLGRAPGRASAQDLTLFDSSGIAVQDLAAAQIVLGLARERGVGIRVSM